MKPLKFQTDFTRPYLPLLKGKYRKNISDVNITMLYKYCILGIKPNWATVEAHISANTNPYPKRFLPVNLGPIGGVK
jgi:hypothetical protein